MTSSRTIILFTTGVLFCLLMSCCGKLFPDEKLSLQRQDYSGTELRTDGYYYTHSEETGVVAFFFLYRNGVSISTGGYVTLDLSEIEKRMMNYKAKSKSDWGVFVVNGDTVQREKWVGSSSSHPKAYRLLYWGNIENDTTIHFTKIYYSEHDKTEDINEIWHFKQFDHKPDSTNSYTQK